jgi:hypothetical protein
MKQNNNQDKVTDFSITDILQAHDILISILLAKIIADAGDTKAYIDKLLEMVEMQDINENAKNHIKMLLTPIKDSL